MRRVGSCARSHTACHRDTCCDLPSCGGMKNISRSGESGSSWTFTSPGRGASEDGDWWTAGSRSRASAPAWASGGA